MELTGCAPQGLRGQGRAGVTSRSPWEKSQVCEVMGFWGLSHPTLRSFGALFTCKEGVMEDQAKGSGMEGGWDLAHCTPISTPPLPRT